MSLRTSIRRTAAPLSCAARLNPSSMPLRAKITNPAWMSGSRMNHTPAHSTAHTPESDLLGPKNYDDPDDVVFSNNYGVRSIELNRPKKLNSLNASMARKIIPRLQEWEKSELAGVVVIKGKGRAFCAGGDVAELAKWNKTGPEGQKRSSDYFALEYMLDHLIATYNKPYVAFLDGITMGGGVGLSIHAPFRIATENSIFAMPETTIGFFPDVGASFFLPRMEGGMGTYLALTSDQLKGADLFYHGVATHYIHSSSLQALESRLAELQFPDYMSARERNAIIDATIEEYSTGLPHARPEISGALRRAVDHVFHADQPSVQSILASLADVENNPDTAADVKTWARKTIDTIHTRSPIAVEVTLQQLRAGRNWTIAQTFQREHQLASRFMAHPDFVEGVTARLVERKKGRPDWQPASIDAVSPDDVAAFFERGDTEPLKLLNDRDYRQYTHAWIGLPTDTEILREAQGKTLDQVVASFVEAKGAKQGIREKVSEVMDRFGVQ